MFSLWCYLSIILSVRVPEFAKIANGIPKQSLALHCLPSDDKSKETENGAEKPAATQFCKLKNACDVGGADDDDSDENAVDSAEVESGDDEVCIRDESYLNYYFLDVLVSDCLDYFLRYQ
jgi:hypothetical protein